jgi:deoxyribodipyrimidine photo-lyase
MPAAVVWFRRDLRLADNPALQAILDAGHVPIPVYIHDEPDHDWPQGQASAWWLHHSLLALKKSLQQCGSDLLVFQGDPETILARLLQQSRADTLVWNRCYEPAQVKRDTCIMEAFTQQGYHVSSHNAALLREPGEILKKDGMPYRVFTPFWKVLHRLGPARQVIPAAACLPAFDADSLSGSLPVAALELLPAVNWYQAFPLHWNPGEAGAGEALNDFCEDGLIDYPTARDIPGVSGTSRLSAHLHFGEISPVQIWHHLMQHAAGNSSAGIITATESYLREIAWREFSHQLLHQFPHTTLQPLDTRFAGFPWRSEYQDLLAHWQQGQTGIPIVDAGMRELWSTGFMHNRVRMIVASFLTKNLLIPWQEGARWFWNTLVDADLANNTMGWQWVAGSGADAAPYFRIFNPVLQGEKFDSGGRYVRRWVPELAGLGDRYIHRPWTADPAVLADAGIRLGDEYPRPLVDLQASRKAALAAWDHVKRHQVQPPAHPQHR